ncbi:zeta toxin family protein [Actinacidiphila glaucinigra]|uniref:zeta toxin family protein n=1 Tax=Actinacidiphila glaucinigra TaxID=235986 RepID=UPI0036B7E9B3
MSGPGQPYQLTKADNRRIFLADIVPDQLAGREPQQEPTVVVLLGQQGAGKTRTSQAIAQRLNERGGFVDLDSDLYKPYHPRYAELMTEDDQLMALHVGPDAREWTHQARTHALENRLNVLAHDTAGDARFSADLLPRYRQAQYRVELVALGVPRALSDQGVLNRYHEQVQDRGQGRLSVPEKVAAAYTGMLDYADIVDAEQLADVVTVYRRGESKPRYLNVLEDGRWTRTPRFREALHETRNTPLTPQETADFLRVQDKLRMEMAPEFQGHLDVISSQAAPLLHPGTVERWQSKPVRPSSAAARSRSTTRSDKPPAQQAPGGPSHGGSDQTVSRRRPDDPDARRGRGR